MDRNIAVLAFATSVLGLFCIFDVIPGVGSFAGSVMLVVGGTVLICVSIMAERAALEPVSRLRARQSSPLPPG